jgi:hypothetical protein
MEKNINIGGKIMKKFILGLIIGILITYIAIIYTLEINNIQNSDTGSLIEIKLFGIDFNYYYE